MVNKALYLRYRPQTFQEVIGQNATIVPLINALNSKKIAHAYLFSGPRGCGKTTCARIFAKCLNCEKGPSSSPCEKCKSCVDLSINGNGSLDVVEIDAASHNGVDDVREISERAVISPNRDRYKIFILDEAHMVTTQGFNALLKLIEEPPEHVKFIFATTAPEKLIPTIRSRTYHYPFRLVSPEKMQEHIAQICKKEKIKVSAEVLSQVVLVGQGSVRDTLSVLDQLISGSVKGEIPNEIATALLGLTPFILLENLLNGLAIKNAVQVFEVADNAVNTGLESKQFVQDLMELLLDLINIKTTKQIPKKIAPELHNFYLQISEKFTTNELVKYIKICSDAIGKMTTATPPRLHFELLIGNLFLYREQLDQPYDLSNSSEQSLPLAKKSEITQPKTTLDSTPTAQKKSPATTPNSLLKNALEILNQKAKQTFEIVNTTTELQQISNKEFSLLFSDSNAFKAFGFGNHKANLKKALTIANNGVKVEYSVQSPSGEVYLTSSFQKLNNNNQPKQPEQAEPPQQIEPSETPQQTEPPEQPKQSKQPEQNQQKSREEIVELGKEFIGKPVE